MARKCPNCGSENTKEVEISNSKFLQCDECGFDESEDLLDVYPEHRSTQSGKSGFSPYKKGGSFRTRK